MCFVLCLDKVCCRVKEREEIKKKSLEKRSQFVVYPVLYVVFHLH